jgi:hypothetical protein
MKNLSRLASHPKLLTGSKLSIGYTVWTLLHNQKNQTNSANLAIFAAFLVVKIISSDHFLLLTIILSHSMSIKSKKLEFFPKFQKFAL